MKPPPLTEFARPSVARSVGQLLIGAAGLVTCWVLAVWSLDVSYLLTLAVAFLGAIMIMRLFIIQHDCGHGSFFRSRAANDAVGYVLGVLTLTPYTYWRKTHAIHHASSGNLDERGFGDIDTLTVKEYLSRGWWGRLRYRLYRSAPSVMVVGPAYQFILKHRLPADAPREWKREWASVWWTNFGLLAVLLALGLTVGFYKVLLIQLPLSWFAASIGVTLFYVQHQFEDTYWQPDPAWTFEEASLKGSSFLDLPPLLRWASGNIGFHHVHHLAPRIPNYRLKSCLEANPDLRSGARLGLKDVVRCLRLKLWDEERGKLVTFRELRARQRARAA